MRRIANFTTVVAVLFALALPGHKAHADFTDLGLLTPTAYVAIYGTHSGNGSVFADTFSFSLSADASLSSILGSIQFSDIIGITGFTSSLWQAGGVSPIATGIDTIVDGPYDTSITKSVISYAPLLAGALPVYEIHTGGTVFGESGKYGGLMTVSPIPEPGVFTMMLAGLGLMGFVVNRRRQAGGGAG